MDGGNWVDWDSLNEYDDDEDPDVTEFGQAVVDYRGGSGMGTNGDKGSPSTVTTPSSSNVNAPGGGGGVVDSGIFAWAQQQAQGLFGGGTSPGDVAESTIFQTLGQTVGGKMSQATQAAETLISGQNGALAPTQQRAGMGTGTILLLGGVAIVGVAGLAWFFASRSKRS